jgi:hypothetical protein
MTKKRDRHFSETPATQFLRQSGIAFTEHPFDYVDTRVVRVWTR